MRVSKDGMSSSKDRMRGALRPSFDGFRMRASFDNLILSLSKDGMRAILRQAQDEGCPSTSSG
jgi:hypothetical protein